MYIFNLDIYLFHNSTEHLKTIKDNYVNAIFSKYHNTTVIFEKLSEKVLAVVDFDSKFFELSKMYPFKQGKTDISVNSDMHSIRGLKIIMLLFTILF